MSKHQRPGVLAWVAALLLQLAHASNVTVVCCSSAAPPIHTAVQSPSVSLPACNGKNSLWDLIRGNDNLSFVALLADVGNTNISNVLSSPEGNYTIFVSTNEAAAEYMAAVYGITSTAAWLSMMHDVHGQHSKHVTSCSAQTPHCKPSRCSNFSSQPPTQSSSPT